MLNWIFDFDCGILSFGFKMMILSFVLFFISYGMLTIFKIMSVKTYISLCAILPVETFVVVVLLAYAVQFLFKFS